jgi:hypothetical protein
MILFVIIATSVWSDAQNARSYTGALEYGRSAIEETHIEEAMALVFLLAIGVGLVAMAYFELRGRRGARIATFIFCGLASLLMFYSMVRSAAGLNRGNAGVATGTAALVVFGFMSFLFLVYVTVIVLLALPPSNRHFRPPPPALAYLPPYPGQRHSTYQSQHGGSDQPPYRR